ncbi:MAG: hypothetical protein OEZ22_05540 [Spirochaetia bacterium]|nr:hypothetical protein [Spirochaetia bacterium]
MKKKIIFISVLLGFALFSMSIAEEKKIKEKYIIDEFQSLLKQHVSFLEKRFENSVLLDTFEKSFFIQMAFIENTQTKNFFNNVAQSFQNYEKNGQAAGYTRISYSSYLFINGDTKSVHYNYQSDGKLVSLEKYTNNNGKLIKAVYNFNIAEKRLDVREFKDNKKLNENEYKI